MELTFGKKAIPETWSARQGINEEATRQGARPTPWARPHPRGCLGTPLVHLRCSVGFFWSKNKFREVSGQLDSV